MDNLPPTAREAKALGLSRYFTGKPCPRGHVAPRRAINTSCMACQRDYNSKETEREARRIYKRTQRLKKRAGCTPQLKAQMIADQAGVCPICQASDKPLFIDHCHTNNRIRAAICHNCNTALGHAKDNPDTLRRMAAYVEHHQNLTEK